MKLGLEKFGDNLCFEFVLGFIGGIRVNSWQKTSH
jgi:hypothetical protein